MEALIKTREIDSEQLRELAAAGWVYAILDACDEPLVPPKMQELGEEKALSLFKGGAQESYWAVAPYLAKVDSGLLQWLGENLDGTPWGIFVFTKTDLLALHRHFRHFLIVQLHDGKQWFFRFYDPRILTTYLPGCNAAELKQFFGPVRGFGVAAEDKVIITEIAPGTADTATLSAAPLSHIRPEQYGALDELAISDFEARVTAHIQEFFPQQCEELGPKGTHEFIRYGIAKAASYEITDETEVCQYIDLMFGFGEDFDSDPEQAWAAQVLNSPQVPPLERMSTLLRQGLGVEQGGK